MANRYPLIVDTADNNKIKELPSGDNLNLEGNDIVNVNNILSNGFVDAFDIKKNGNSLAEVATTGDFNSLNNTPIFFSGDYQDLANKPNIPSQLFELEDVDAFGIQNNQALVYNDISGRFEPTDITSDVDLSNYNLNELNDVIITGNTTNKFFKYFSGAWRAANVTWTDVQNKPDLVTREELSNIDIDVKADITGSIFADDSTLMVDSVNGTIPATVTGSIFDSNNSVLLADPVSTDCFYNLRSRDGTSLLVDAESSKILGAIDTFSLQIGGNNTPITSISTDTTLTNASNASLPTELAVKTYVDDSIANFDTVGNFSFTGSIIDTDDSSPISVTPAVNLSSDLTVQNDLNVLNDVIIKGSISTDSDGIAELSSDTELLLTAGTRVELTSSPLKMSSFSTIERDNLTAQNGDVIYNTTTGKFQGYAAGIWVDLH